jgi:polysulfide reductase chain C
MSEISWGILLAVYLFVGGLAGGSYIVAVLADFFGKKQYKVLSKSGTYVSLVSIIVGLIVLVLDLGRFDVDPLGVLNAYINFPTSIMAVGTWIITGLSVVSFITAILWFFQGSSIVRKLVEIIGLVLALSTAAYTGLLLAFARGRPFWNSPFLPVTFIVSGTLTGLVMSLLLIPIITWFMPRFFKEFKELYNNKTDFSEMLIKSQSFILILIIVEIALVIIEVGTGHGGGSLLSMANISMPFIGYIVLGLLIPLGIAYYSRRVDYRSIGIVKPASLASFILVLIGGFLLRYVVLYAGQLIA